MPSRVSLPLVEVFLLVEQPRQRLSHWSQALAPLDDAAAPPLASVDAYYDPASNQALFGLRYDEQALGATGMSYIVDVALLAEIGMIQPAELSEGDRRRFLGDRLSRCTVHVGDQRKIVAALAELVRCVRSQKMTMTPPAELASPTSLTPPSSPRGRTVSIAGQARAQLRGTRPLAKGTRTIGADPRVLMAAKASIERPLGSIPPSNVPVMTTAEPAQESDAKQVVSEPTATAE